MGGTIKSIVREPLVHFLLAGFCVFLFSAWRGDAVDPASRTITISAPIVDRLAQGWAQTWQRHPNDAELDGLIRDYVKEEVFYREAKRLGLDEDDSVIRRRLRSKMEFLAGAEVENETPDEGVLARWLAKNPQKYEPDARYSFDQIYLGSSGSETGKVGAVKAQLHAGADWKQLGRPISLPASGERVAKTDVLRDFGDAFLQSLSGLKPGEWSGPIASGFGEHLVRLRAITAPTTPKLADVRQAVENDWRAATLRDRETKAYKVLLDSYTIRIAKP